MVPQYARQRNRLVLERLEKLRKRAEESPLNVLEAGSSDFGIIASGIAYAYAREAFPKAWFLKLGMSHPLPYAKVARLYDHVSRVAVVEELDPFFEDQVRALGLPVIGKAAIPADGELDQETVFRALEPYVLRKPPRRRQAGHAAGAQARHAAAAGARPARQAAGALPRLLPPLRLLRPAQAPPRPHGRHRLLHARRAAAAAGARQLPVHGRQHRHDVRLQQGARARRRRSGVIGDSTFFHSGVTPLIDAFYNEVEGMVVILDNRTTAMTGHQGHPGTGLHPDRAQGPTVDIQKLCEGIGVRCVTVDATDHKALDAAIKAEAKAPGLGVLIALAPCVLMTREQAGEVVVDEERCNLCGVCVDLGCPALAPGDDAMSVLETCTGCGLCVEVCRRGGLSLACAEDEA